jgi:HlyD family secretion protein
MTQRTVAPLLGTAPQHAVSDSVRGYLFGGVVVIALLVGGIGGWAATSDLAGAVLAQGTVVVDSNVKKVQHPTGGIIGEIRVKDGDRVNPGDLLVRLDETATRANLLTVTKQLDEIAMRQARLKAERDGADSVAVPKMLADRFAVAEIQDIISGERSMFESRRSGRASQKGQLKERMAQLREEIQGLTGQLAGKTQEVQLVRKELVGLETLEEKQLITMPRMTGTRRDVARLDAERGQLTAQIAQAKGKISETELQILQIDQDLRTEIVKDLRESQGKEAELIERRITADDQLRRIEIRAPQAGFVHQSIVHTIGGVINPSEPLMLIVPEGDKLVIEAKVAQQDIEQIHQGQLAWLRFTAFNQRTTPEVQGTIDRIAPDLIREPQTGVAYYVARVHISQDEQARLAPSKMLPGMSVDVQIKTTDRTALSYFLKPLQDQFAKAFKER